MSAERYEIFDDGALTIAIKLGENTQYVDELEDDFVVGAIRQQASDIAELRAECDLLTHKVICCGVAAWHSDPLLTTTGAYAGKWNSPQADCVRKLRAERDQLRADLAAAVARRDECASKLGNLLAVIHRDGGHYESEHGTEKACADAELAVHVQRGIADGYHDALKIWRQRAEQSEARLAAIDGAPTVAVVSECAAGLYVHQKLFGAQLAEPGAELIYRPAKDQT